METDLSRLDGLHDIRPGEPNVAVLQSISDDTDTTYHQLISLNHKQYTKHARHDLPLFTIHSSR